MQQLKERIGSTWFLERLLKAESAILGINLLCGLFLGWGLVGVPIIVGVFCLAVYRLLILSGLKDGSPLAAWWYCVTSFFFVLRFGFLIAAQFGSAAISKDMVSPIALLFLIVVMMVRLTGVLRTYFIDLSSGTRLTASIAMGLGTLGYFAGFGWVRIAAALESVFYGFQIRLH